MLLYHYGLTQKEKRNSLVEVFPPGDAAEQSGSFSERVSVNVEHLKEVSATLRVRNAWIPVSPVQRVVYLDISHSGKTENWVDCKFPLGVLVLLCFILTCLSPSYNFSHLFTLGNFGFSLDCQKTSKIERCLFYFKKFCSFLALKYCIH